MSYGISPLEKIWPTVQAVIRAQEFFDNKIHFPRPRCPFFWHGNHVLIIWRFQFWVDARETADHWWQRRLMVGYMKVRRFGQVLRVCRFP